MNDQTCEQNICQKVGDLTHGLWMNWTEEVNKLEREAIENALFATENNKAAAARLLKMNRTTLVEKLRKHHLSHKYFCQRRNLNRSIYDKPCANN